MEKNNKNGFKWRGLATFSLIFGILIETISGVILYITPIGRIANWTNWALFGLNKQEWAAIHTVFGYFLLIVIGLHLYFNWRVIVHFFWSRLHSAFNLKKELAVALVVILIIFAGTLWNIPPFSSVMDLGRDAKLSWGEDIDILQSRGSRWAQSAHIGERSSLNQQGNRHLTNTGRFYSVDETKKPENRVGYGRNIGTYYENFTGRGQGRGRTLNQNNTSGSYSENYAGDRASTTLKGRDFTRLGQSQTISGTLIQNGDEWEFKVGDTKYEIHMGPSEYRESRGLVLHDGSDAVISGFVYGTDISVATIDIGGKSFTLRDETGRPAWSGTGFGKGSGRLF